MCKVIYYTNYMPNDGFKLFKFNSLCAYCNKQRPPLPAEFRLHVSPITKTMMKKLNYNWSSTKLYWVTLFRKLLFINVYDKLACL